MQKIIVGICIAVLACFGTANAQFATGKYAGEFMATGVGGRALALGGAYVALVSDVTAGYWNPAALQRMKYPEIGLMHEQRFGGELNYNYGAVAWPIDSKNTAAFSITRMGVDNIPDTRNAWTDLNGNGRLDDNERLNVNDIPVFNTAMWAAYLSYAFHGFDNIALGVNMKLIMHELAESNAYGFGFDVAALYRVTDALTVGANVQDITTTMVAWDTGRNDLILPTVKVGAAYRYAALGGAFTPVVDLDIRAEGREFASTMHVGPVSVDPHVGLEYQFKDVFALRVGYSDIQTLTFGAGIHLPKLYLDYAFGESPLSDGGIANDPSHRISVRLQLEEPKFFRETLF